MEFIKKYDYTKRFQLGFVMPVCRCYMPVPLQVRINKDCVFALSFLESKVVPHSPDWQEAYVMAAEDFDRDGEHALFIRRISQERDAHQIVGHDDAIELMFDAEKFFYIMENASKQNKLVFFRHAYLPNIVEANKFLALIDHSDLGRKDRNRAYTWTQKLVKQQGLKTHRHEE